jgi:DNA modification methylase
MSLQQGSVTDGRPMYRSMELVDVSDYRKFVSVHDKVVIGNVIVKIGKPWNIKEYSPPHDYKPEDSTVWSFPSRGDWATHSGNYRGNWSPYIPRNLINKYTSPGDTVLDQMCGSGTTLVECKLLGRNGIGMDVNPDALMVARDRLNFDYSPLERLNNVSNRTYLGDARNMDRIKTETIDLVATHPPYAGIISYTGQSVPDDLSRLKLPEYLAAIRIVAAESYRVLKPDHYCGVLIGDTRKSRHYIPISIGVLQAFLSVGYTLKEDIIKLQHKMMGTRLKWRGRNYDFYKIAHEHLYIFRKPGVEEDLSKVKYSRRWW